MGCNYTGRHGQLQIDWEEALWAEVAMIKIGREGGGGGTGGGKRVGGRGRKGTEAEGEKFYECGCQCKATAHLPPRPSQINTGSKSPQPRMLAACQGPRQPLLRPFKTEDTHTLSLSLCLSLSHTNTHTLSVSLSHTLSLSHTHTNAHTGTHTPIGYKVLYMHSDLQACTQSSKRERETKLTRLHTDMLCRHIYIRTFCSIHNHTLSHYSPTHT